MMKPRFELTVKSVLWFMTTLVMVIVLGCIGLCLGFCMGSILAWCAGGWIWTVSLVGMAFLGAVGGGWLAIRLSPVGRARRKREFVEKPSSGKRWRWALTCIGVLLIMLTARQFFANVWPTFRVQQQMDLNLLSDKLSEIEPIYGKEIETIYWPIADVDNAATLYLEVVSHMKEFSGDSDTYDYALENVWGGDKYEELERWLNDNKDCLELTMKAARMQKCWFPPKLDLTSLPTPVSSMRKLARMLIIMGKHDEYRGDIQEAVEKYVLVARMGHHISYGTPLIYRLVGIAIREVGVSALQEHATQATHTIGLYRKMIQGLDEAEQLRSPFHETLAVETIFSQYQQQALNSATTGAVAGGEGFLSDGITRGLVERLKTVAEWSQLAPLEGIREFRKHEEEMQKVLRQPMIVATRFILDKNSLGESIGDILAAMLVPALWRGYEMELRCRVRENAVKLVAALQAYRSDHGRYPATLEDLLPSYLKTIPQDPFSRKSLRYVNTDDATFVYSYGLDLDDDGGVDAGWRGVSWETDGDMVIYLRRTSEID